MRHIDELTAAQVEEIIASHYAARKGAAKETGKVRRYPGGIVRVDYVVPARLHLGAPTPE